MQLKRRYDRFDPITVRAASRLVALWETRHLASWELDAYLRELAALVPGLGADAARPLKRIARRRSALGLAVIPNSFRNGRRLGRMPGSIRSTRRPGMPTAETHPQRTSRAG